MDLAIEDHFSRIRTRLLEVDPDSATKLGTALVRDRLVVRRFSELDDGYLEEFADLMDGVLDAYDKLFGFQEWSKVPGKKLRVRVRYYSFAEFEKALSNVIEDVETRRAVDDLFP